MTDDERAAALRFDKDVYDAACVLAQSAPLDLNEFHFEQLAIVSPRLEADAREKVRTAQLAIVRANQAAAQTKAAESAAPDDTDDGLTWKQFVAKYANEPMTLGTVVAIIAPLEKAWKDMNARNEQRNVKIAALEARVLELEAQAAARTVAHVGR
jgi:hypothetical protein